MNYEKKYNEALAKARTFYKKWDGVDAYNSSLAISELKEIFPELKESGDEMIRKEMLQIAKESEDSFYMVLTPKKRETLIAWLEKQSKQNLTWSEEDDKRINRIYDFLWKHKRGFSAIIWQIEEDANWLKSLKERVQLKQNEQKSVDGVEPKFRIEAKKWYICISQYGNCIEGRCYQALSDGRIIDDFGTEYDMHSDADKYFRLWTIEDVKDSNVLYSPEHNLLWIYKDKDTYHVATNLNYPHNISIGGDIVIPSDVCPAPKEQCDILFARIKKYGYTWDKDTKKLIKL